MITAENAKKEQIAKYIGVLSFYNDENIARIQKSFSKDREAAQYEEYFYAYKSIVYKTAQLMRSLGIKDPLETSVAFEYLLWKGYFSKDRKFEYSVTGRCNLFASSGAEIMRGKAVCLNNADMLARVLNNMDNEAYVLGASVEKEHADISYRPSIQIKVDQTSQSFIPNANQDVKETLGNHAAVVTKYGANYIISDPTNLAFANFTDVLEACYVGSKRNFDVKPNLTLSVESIDRDHLANVISTSFLHSDERPLKESMVKDKSESALSTCRKNSFVLDDFHDDCIKEIDIVCKTLKKAK